jgi:hypothetical protein
MDVKLAWIGSILLAFGLTSTVLSYPNLYDLKSELMYFDTMPIAAKSSNEHSFLTSVGYVKKVEVVVYDGPWGMNSMWGNCCWIRHPFEIALINGSQFSLLITTEQSPPVEYIFDIPNTWNSLGGVRISNPEDNPAAVNVAIIFHSQVPNFLWQTTMYLGLTSIIIGAIITAVAVYRRKQTI